MADRRRIEGWKAIATHFDRGVRTVQRWERDLGMPVRRRGTGRGEVVFAFVDELDAWQARSETAGNSLEDAPDTQNAAAGETVLATPSGPASHSLSSRYRTALAIAVVVLIPAALWLTLRGRSPARVGNPASARVENGALVVRGVDGTVLWSKVFAFALNDRTYAEFSRYSRSMLEVSDVDGDGAREVLFGIPRGAPAADADGLYLFGADGSTRFRHRPTYRARFGPYVGAPPWQLIHVAFGPLVGGRRTIWAASSVAYYPSVLERIDPGGRAEAVYWSDGHITSVTFATLEGRGVVIVGGSNNEWKGGALAVLDRAGAGATAPAVNPEYRCVEGCPAAAPLAYVVWPASPLMAPLGGTEPVLGPASVRDDGQIEVVTGKTGNWDDLLPQPGLGGARRYVLDSRLRLIRAELGEDYARTYEQLALIRRIPPFDPRPARHLYPMLRWENGRFVRVDGPEVGPLVPPRASTAQAAR